MRVKHIAEMTNALTAELSNFDEATLTRGLAGAVHVDPLISSPRVQAIVEDRKYEAAEEALDSTLGDLKNLLAEENQLP